MVSCFPTWPSIRMALGNRAARAGDSLFMQVIEKQRKKLAEKIDQLNSAIDNVSTQLWTEEPPTEEALSTEDIEAVV